jgi:hypothetical protein
VVFELNGDKIMNKEVRENRFTNHRLQKYEHNDHNHNHGEAGGHSHAGLIEGLKDCKYLISEGGGWRVVEDLKQHNIHTLFSNVEFIDDAVKKFIKGDLQNDIELICNHKS